MSMHSLRQFGILDLLLLMAFAAAWIAAGVNSSRIDALQARIDAARRAAEELHVDDPAVYNAIEQTVVRYPDQAWQVYLPAGRQYRLHVVTRGITADGFPANATHQFAELKPGQYRVALVHEQDTDGNPRFVITAGEGPGAVKLVAQETADWNPSGGATSSGVNKQQVTATLVRPLVLKRQRVNVKLPGGSIKSQPGNVPANGLLIWIEAQ